MKITLKGCEHKFVATQFVDRGRLLGLCISCYARLIDVSYDSKYGYRWALANPPGYCTHEVYFSPEHFSALCAIGEHITKNKPYMDAYCPHCLRVLRRTKDGSDSWKDVLDYTFRILELP